MKSSDLNSLITAAQQPVSRLRDPVPVTQPYEPLAPTPMQVTAAPVEPSA